MVSGEISAGALLVVSVSISSLGEAGVAERASEWSLFVVHADQVVFHVRQFVECPIAQFASEMFVEATRVFVENFERAP